MIALRYVGPRYVIGVPARDLTVDDPDEAERLIATGCYVADTPTDAPASDTAPAEPEAHDTAEDDVPAEDEDVVDVPDGD